MDRLETFELQLTDGRTERVVAQQWQRRGAVLVFTTTQLVMDRPREVVARRIPAVEVRHVRVATVDP